MIILKKLNGEEFVLNSDLIETIMETPDTTILPDQRKASDCQGVQGRSGKEGSGIPQRCFPRHSGTD